MRCESCGVDTPHEGQCEPCSEAGLEKYVQLSYRRFIQHARDLGYEPHHYRGRFFYKGPAIDVDRAELDRVRRWFERAGQPYQVDNLGLDFIVYAL